ncbi:MAG: hypothetical protein HYR63_00345 [Proteobacteria bacterium]|nr:hypothetical protein [Pseudomonadota bacterium]
MSNATHPHYILIGASLAFRPVLAAYPAEAARALAEFGPTALPRLDPTSISAVMVAGPLALAWDKRTQVIMRHGSKKSVSEWMAGVSRRPEILQRMNLEVLEFPATSLGVRALNARLLNAHLEQRLMWGAGPGEKPEQLQD